MGQVLGRMLPSNGEAVHHFSFLRAYTLKFPLGKQVMRTLTGQGRNVSAPA